jgi:hypothetical protein
VPGKPRPVGGELHLREISQLFGIKEKEVLDHLRKKTVIPFLNSFFQTKTSNLASKMKTIFLLTFHEIESIF